MDTVAVNGNFKAENRLKKYWKLTEKCTENPLKQEFVHYMFLSISYTIFSKTNSSERLVFYMKIKFNQKSTFKVICINLLILYASFFNGF